MSTFMFGREGLSRRALVLGAVMAEYIDMMF